MDFGAIMSYFNEYNKLGLMTIYKNHDRYDKSNVTVEGNSIKRYSKKDRAEGIIYIDYGASILRREVLELVPQNQVYFLEELFALLIEQEELLAYEVNKRFYQIGSFEGIEEFSQYILRFGVAQ